MRPPFLVLALSTTLLFSATACSNNVSPVGAPVSNIREPQGLPSPFSRDDIPVGARRVPVGLRFRAAARPDGAIGGIYVAQPSFEYVNVWGYLGNNRGNNPPQCYYQYLAVNDVAVSGDGSVIFPTYEPGFVTVQPNIIGFCSIGLSWQLFDIDGYSVDAASNDAIHGIIAVANYYGYNQPGNILICSQSSGCNKLLTNPNMPNPLGVAMTKSGDCFGDSTSGLSSSPGTLTYFAKCNGKGQAVLGFINPYGGGLDIDGDGNLVTISEHPQYGKSAIYVYHGCTPLCLKVSGPHYLKGNVIYGHLNKFSTRLVTADYYNNTVDVYRYSPKHIKYLYSFNNGLSPNVPVIGAAVYPRSRE